MTKLNELKWQKIKLVVLILFLAIWVSACQSDPIYVKPNGALTVPMEKKVRDEFDTTRTLLIKFEHNAQAIDEGNARFKAIRTD